MTAPTQQEGSALREKIVRLIREGAGAQMCNGPCCNDKRKSIADDIIEILPELRASPLAGKDGGDCDYCNGKGWTEGFPVAYEGAKLGKIRCEKCHGTGRCSAPLTPGGREHAYPVFTHDH